MPINVYNTPQIVYLVLPESGNTSGPILMNYPINRTFFKIIQGITNTLEIFVQDVDHQISMLTTASSGLASFSGTAGTDVPQGTIITTPDANVFVTQADYTIGTSTTVAIVSQSIPGTNYVSGTLLTTPLSGVDAMLTGAITGGQTAPLSFNIVDPNPYNNVVLLTRQMVLVDPTRALYSVTITPSDMYDWAIGDYQYSVTVNNPDGSVGILYTDLDYSPYGTLALAPGPFPQPAPIKTMDPTGWNVLSFYSYSPVLIGSAQFGYPQGSQTFTFYTNAYTGVVNIFGSLQASPDPSNTADWFMITQPYYTLANGPQQVTVNGNYLWLFVQLPVFQSMLYPNMPSVTPPYVAGSITQVLYKN